MKKTLTINISGTVFHIDEDAYDQLKNYLSKISDHFRKEEGGHEIINDIEARISEIFSQKTGTTNEVVTVTMVNEIIQIMGLPEDFEAFDEDNSFEQEMKTHNTSGGYVRQNKRLYRDTESMVFGGVCSGLSHYLKMDKILVRILFIILIVVTSGAAIPAYIILWIAVPKARTTSQRLEMKGEEINVGSIGKSVKEDFSEMKDHSDKYKNSKEFTKEKEYDRQTVQNRHYDGEKTVNVFTKILGAIFLFIGIVSLVGLLVGAMATTRLMSFLPNFFGNSTGLFINHFYSGSFVTTLVISIFIIAGIPLLLLIYAGTKMLFNYVANSRNVILSALGVWIIGIIIATGSILGAIDVFSAEASISDKSIITNIPDTLFIQIDSLKFNDLSETKYEFNQLMIMMKGDEEVLVSRPKFTIEPTNEKTIALKIKKTSRGNNYREAKKNAEEISFQFVQNGSTLLFDPFFTINEQGKWRSQGLKIILEIPEGKVVYLNNNLLPVIHDIKNTTNTWDGDMIGQFWTMKPEGLTLSK